MRGFRGMAGMSYTDDGGRGRIRPASRLVATVADLLAMHIQNGHPLDSAEVADLFLSLARFRSSFVFLCLSFRVYVFVRSETLG